MIVGIQVRRSMSATTMRQILVVHLPRGEKRFAPRLRIAVSAPKTKFTYPWRNIAAVPLLVEDTVFG